MERSFEGGGGGGAFEDGEISIAWRNLDYSVGELSSWKYQRKPILRGLTGAFRTGSLNGLLGPSGAGKTTLLNCLSGCLTSGALSGEIFLNSDRSSAAFYYIAQHVHENIFSELTVGQLLRYAFAFKNGRRVKNSVREEHISKTLEVLALGGSEEEPTSKSADSSKTKKKKDSILKRPFVLCSGGEQKRISIAQELMSLDGRFNLFLDEPTTGLDSATAYGLVACLRRLAATNGNTIIASIHTPNEETLQLFDQLYIMARGGVAIFSGSPASLSTRLKELEDSDFENSDEDSDLEMETVFTSPEAPPIEAMLKVACRGFEHEDVLQLAGPVKVQSNLAISKQITSLTRQPQGGIQQSYKLFNPCDLLTETLRLFRLTFFNARSSLLSTFLLFVFFFVMLTSIFDHHKATAKGCFSVVPVFSPNESTANSSGGQPVCQNIEQSLLTNELLSENLHFLSYTVYLIGMISLVANVSLFGKYLKVLLSEHHNRWYSLGVFYSSTTVITFLELNLTAFYLTLLTYFLSNQHVVDDHAINWHRLTTYTAFIWLQCLFYQTLGQLLGILLVNHLAIATTLSQVLFCATALFNGVYVKLHRAPWPLLSALGEHLGIVAMTRGLFYSIYGIDRCDPQTEASVVLVDNQIDPERVWAYFQQVLLNVVAIRLLTFVIMFFRFSRFPAFCCFLCRKRSSPAVDDKETAVVVAIPMEITPYTPKKKRAAHNRNRRSTFDDIILRGNRNISAGRNKRRASEHAARLELKRRSSIFLADKPLIGFRNLSLYRCNSRITGETPTDAPGKAILRQLSGGFAFASLNAILGASGAGKSSLLKVLNGRSKTRLTADSELYMSRYTPITTCFISQHIADHLSPGLTAKQMLIYASRLKNADLAAYRLKVDHEAIALQWLEEFSLLGAANTRVERCSGGEQKRLAVAQELTALESLPNLCLIDEPVSGLDSSSAEIVIAVLRALAHTHSITVVTTIHQPSSVILALYDQLYILARGGVCVFSGALDEVEPHLQATFHPEDDPDQPTPLHHRYAYPIEELIKHACNDWRHPIVQKLATANEKRLAEDGEAAWARQHLQLAPDGVPRNRARFTFASVWALAARYAAYIGGHLWKLYALQLVTYLSYGTVLSMVFPPDIASVSGCYDPEDDFNNTCSKSAEDIANDLLLEDNLRYTFLAQLVYLLLVAFSAAISFGGIFKYFVLEHRNGWYSSGVFYLVNSAYEVAFITAVNVVYIFLIDLYEPIRPGTYWSLLLLFNLAAVAYQGVAQCVALLAGQRSLTMQNNLLICTTLMQMLLSNSFVPLKRLHYVFRLVSNLSVIRLLHEDVILLLYGFHRCRRRQVHAILYHMEVEDEDYRRNLILLVFNLLLFRVLSIYLLMAKVNPVEHSRRRAEKVRRYVKALKAPLVDIPGLDCLSPPPQPSKKKEGDGMSPPPNSSSASSDD